MSDKVIVVVQDEADSKRGEITVVEDPLAAEHLVGTLLEAGFQQERIRLFSGEQAQVHVSTRPVVAFTDELDADAPPPIGNAEPQQDTSEPTTEEATPFVKEGVRFSSLFRRA